MNKMETIAPRPGRVQDRVSGKMIVQFDGIPDDAIVFTADNGIVRTLVALTRPAQDLRIMMPSWLSPLA